jgi:ABC-2 type transport system ATP-binding protein
MVVRVSLLIAAVGAAGCTDNKPTAPRPTPPPPRFATDPGSDGPPPAHSFGPDTYSTGAFTGAGTTQPGLDCVKAADKSRVCNGFLASDVDGTLLDATLQVPAGGGPFPLVVVMHGWAGSKTGSEDVADALVSDGFAVLRYSARGFGESWGQANLADPHAEIADLRSLVGQLVDQGRFHLNPDAVAVTGASYGGGHSWLATLQPTFTSPGGLAIRIRTVVPIVPWTDLLYALLPNGRPHNSIDGLGSAKLSYINGLFGSGVRHSADRPYPNYPTYLATWESWINTTEPNGADPLYGQIVDGLAGGRSVWWQQAFWSSVVSNRIPVFEVQGFTDDLFPLPEAARTVHALRSVDPSYPITLYLGDIGHPRASNKPGEVSYVEGLIQQWFDYYLKGVGSEPAHNVMAAITRPPAGAFDPSNVITAPTIEALATSTATRSFDGSAVLVNPASDPSGGVVWDPFANIGVEELQPYTGTPPEPPVVDNSLAVYTIPAATLNGGADVLVAGCPVVRLHASTLATRVQLDVRMYDVAADGTRQLITRGTYTADNGAAPIGDTDLTIPTYGNLWRVPADHTIRIELTNLDAPYIAPSRVPSVTTISGVNVDIPLR